MRPLARAGTPVPKPTPSSLRSPPSARLCLTLVLTLVTSCAGYRLGPTGGQTAQARSVSVPFFVNQTLQPRLSETVTQALRRQLQQDGTFRLETREEGDLVLQGTLLEYERLPVAYQPRDLVSVQEYELRLTARVIARERSSGKIVLERQVTGRTTVSVGPDLFSVERQAAPLLADDLARNITTALAEGSW